MTQWAKVVKRDVVALYLAARDPRVPWYAKAMAGAVAAYALSPIDLIPDFIPVIGYLDDLVIVPVGIRLTVRLIPPPLMDEFRAEAACNTRGRASPYNPASTEASMAMRETAQAFFDACETGKGWSVCQQYCHPAATFAAQTGALAGVNTLQQYTDWMKGLYGPCPDASYEVRSFAVDEARKNVSAYGVFRATHTGQGGPVPPTGKKVEADYVYVMEFDGDRIKHMTKIWNDAISLKQLGWA